jgi:regulator of PEP synthase PpsR (kinase-PPPase family)
VKKEDLEIKSLLLNDLFLDYVCAHSETLSDLHQDDAISALATEEELQAARDIIMGQNCDVIKLSTRESEELKNAILSAVHSP